MTTETVDPETLVDEDLIQRFRDQLDEGPGFDVPCDRHRFQDCSQQPAEYGAITADHGDCGSWRRDYCGPCFEWIREQGFRCLTCGTRKVALIRYWRL